MTTNKDGTTDLMSVEISDFLDQLYHYQTIGNYYGASYCPQSKSLDDPFLRERSGFTQLEN